MFRKLVNFFHKRKCTFVHFDTTFRVYDWTEIEKRYVRIDYFYCQHSLEIYEVKRDEVHFTSSPPSWFK
jgi:hypothetical protein